MFSTCDRTASISVKHCFHGFMTLSNKIIVYAQTLICLGDFAQGSVNFRISDRVAVAQWRGSSF